MKKKRVVITGIGIVSSLGHNRETTWDRVCAGESGADYIQQFDARSWPTKIACEVKDFSFDKDCVDRASYSFVNRPISFGVQAAKEAVNDSRILEFVDPSRLGISIGAGVGPVTPKFVKKVIDRKSLAELGNDAKQVRNHPGILVGLLSEKWKALGPMTTIHSACASSGQSLGQAFLQIQRGEADAIIAGGSDSLSAELLLAGFCTLGTLSTQNEDPKSASKPFDRNRDGFVAGEGAAMLILEEYEFAKKRGAKIYAEFCGYGETESAYRVTDLPENGRGIVEAMHLALEQSDFPIEKVDYVNAHGTSTELNDRVEALAIRRVFGARGVHPLVSSTKSEIGHLISAAGAMEAAFCALAIKTGRVPPNRNLQETDCGHDISFVEEERSLPIRAAISNSIGFGGSNTCIALKQVDQ